MSVSVQGNEIVLIGTVGGDAWWEDEVFSHADVLAALAQVGRDTDVVVRVNSGGGVATEGAAIHSTFTAHRGKVDMVVEGWAASAASLFVMAGDTITLRPGSLLMIHEPAAPTWGNAADHQRTAEALDVMAGVYAQVYADRCGQSPEAVRALMRAETWLGPADAVAQGFADAAPAEGAAGEPVAFAQVRAYARAPERITALAQARGWSARAAMAAPSLPTRSTMETPVPDTPTPETPAPAPDAPKPDTPKPGGAPAPEDDTPADPVAVAKACATAGYAELTASLLERRASLSAVKARLAEAAGIADAGQRARQPTLARRLIAEGVSEATARGILTDAAAERDEALITDSARPPGSRKAPALNRKDIYARMNGLKG